MSAIANGLALHGGFIPYVGTFLTFSDYARNALRMAALMKLRIDLRLHPRLDRPGRGRPDAPVGRARREPAPHSAPGRLAARATPSRPRSPGSRRSSARDGPTALVLSRARTCRSSRATPTQIADIRRGGYVLADCDPRAGARAVVIATGSEVALALGARDSARRRGHRRARRVDALHQRVRPPGRRLARAVLPRRRAARRRRGRRHRLAGASTSAPSTIRAAPWSASTASANRRPPPRCSSTSASPSTHVARRGPRASS